MPVFSKHDYGRMEEYWAPRPSHLDKLIYDVAGNVRSIEDLYSLAKKAFGGDIHTWKQSEIGFYFNLEARLEETREKANALRRETKRLKEIEESGVIQGYEEWEAAW